MTLTPELLANFTDRVETAQRTAQAMAKLTDDYPAMTVRDGYAVQFELRRRWLAQGQRQTGWKAGLTSRAKMKQMGIDVPSIGFLMASMYRPEGSAVETKDLLHPRVECEIAFVTRQPLSGTDCGREQVLAATDFVVPAIEIIDSRYAGFKFDLPSVIADNGSSARYVTGGQPHDPKALELDTIGVVFEKNGETVGLGTSAAVMGHPADAVVLLVKVLHELGETLPAGSLVLSGGITEAVAVKPGDAVLARYQGMGSVAIRFV